MDFALEKELSLDLLNAMEAGFALWEVVYLKNGGTNLRLLFANDFYAASIRRQLDEILGKTFSELQPRDVSWLPIFSEVALRKRGVYVSETYGQEVQFYLHGHVFSPLPGYVAFVTHNRTQFVKSEMEKEQEEQRIRMMLNILPEGICYCSAVYDDNSDKAVDVHCIMVNEAFEIYEGVRIGSLQGHGFYELYPGRDKINLRKVDEALRNNEKTTYLREGAGGRIIEVNIYPQANKQLFVFQRDVTARMKAIEARKRIQANISHDMRTPLNGIIGLAELGLDDTADYAKQRDYLSKIKSSAEGLLSIINDILDFTKIDTGKMELERIPFCLNELIGECKTIIQREAEERGIALYFNNKSGIESKIIGDPTKLRRALLNFLSNGIKFTKQGYVSLLVKRDEIASQNGAAALYFEIEDTGIGMTEEQCHNAFEPFAQAVESTARNFGGTGLGLSIAKNIIEMMGGRIHVKSAPGIGSIFSFSIVFEISAGKKSQSKIGGNRMAAIEQPLFDGDVLVCEDHEMNKLVIAESLKKLGLSVTIAENGSIGVDKVRSRQKPFDIILVDTQMPVMDGLSTTKKIREMGHNTPIIALSAGVMPEDKKRYMASGISDYLSKPFKQQDLWICLLKYLKPVGQKPVDALSRSSKNDKAIDRELGIENCAGNEAYYEKALAIFLKSGRNTYMRIEKAIAAQNYSLAHEIAHKESGFAAVIGAVKLTKLLSVLAKGLKTGPPDYRNEMLADYGDELGSVLNYIETRHLGNSSR